jgi:cobalt/nickel transport system permease protein
MSGAFVPVEGCRWATLDSRAKIIGLMGGALAISAAPSLLVLGVQLGLAGTVVAGSRLSWRWVLQRCALVTPFAAMMAAFLAFERAPDYAPSLLVLGKAYGSVLVLGMLVASTPVPELVAGLERLRVPSVLVVTASFTYRYAQLLEQEWARMDRARLSRSGRTGRKVAWGPRLAALFVRSWDRAERVAAAMTSRGFTGTLPRGEARPLHAGDYAFAAGLLVLALPLLFA